VSEFRELFEAGTVDVVQADLTHLGGLTSLRKLAGWAQAYGLTSPTRGCSTWSPGRRAWTPSMAASRCRRFPGWG
jgi:L-alanine-DL-glutamate epimerase-like enolase superfamily enzyme